MLSNTLIVKLPDQDIDRLLAPDHNHENSRMKFKRLLKEKIEKITDCTMISIQFDAVNDLIINFGKNPAPNDTEQTIRGIYQAVLIQDNWQSYDGEGFAGIS